MAEQATPTQGTEQAPSVEDRLQGFFSRTEQAEAEQAETVQPTDGKVSDELTPDDLPSDEQAPAQPADEDAFEFEAAGQKYKLSRAETIKHAQQGIDYTQKTMALAETVRQVNERASRLAAIEQVQPVLQGAQAQVIGLASQLQPFQSVDWVRLANDDPLEYAKLKARHDTIQQHYQGAVNQYQNLASAVEQQKVAVSHQMIQHEAKQLTERIPTWKDPEKYKAGATELKSYLIDQGAPADRVDGLASALEVSIAWKAMQYDKLLKAKGDKVKQLRTTPQLTRPNSSDSGAPEKNAQLSQRLKKTGDLHDAAAVLLNRWK